jgi:hypothetical protein
MVLVNENKDANPWPHNEFKVPNGGRACYPDCKACEWERRQHWREQLLRDTDRSYKSRSQYERNEGLCQIASS